MNKKSEFVRNQLQYLLLQLEVNQLNSLLEFSSEILLFFAKYSFLFENSSDSINSCTADTSQFLMPQAFRERPVMYLDPNGLEQVYFIYTYKNTEYDQKMKSHERNSINDDISRLESKGVSVKVLESATKKDILNAISDNEARIIITSGHGYTNNDGIQTSDSDSFSPLDLKGQPIGDSLNTVIFENCFQGDMETEWENAFGNNIDVVGWKGKTNTFETISFNGIGIFDRQESNLKDYLENSVVTNEVDTISSAAPVIDKKGK